MGKKRHANKRKRGGDQPAASAKRIRALFDPGCLVDEQDGPGFFFELANADTVRYKCSGGVELAIAQDRSIHGEGVPQTGGIVWETAFLLAGYLVRMYSGRPPPERLLELGAGCGLLGLVLCQELGARGVLTDMPLATRNIEANISQNQPRMTRGSAESAVLRWDQPEDRAGLEPGPGLIVGTDVVFSVKLVRPLLETAHALAGPETQVYLCLQTRCPDAHAALLREAPRYFRLQDASAELHAMPVGGKLAKSMECHLLRLDNRREL